jgi:N-acyl-D-aspartate/D-glutamate deacylase
VPFSSHQTFGCQRSGHAGTVALDGIAELIGADGCVLGLSDAGAHVGQICDAVLPTDFLAHWVRDRGVVTIEQGVRKLSGELADLLGLKRGHLAVGWSADVNVIDYLALEPGPVRRVRDMPAAGERLVAVSPTGIETTVVNGVVTRRDGSMASADVRRGAGRVLRSRAVTSSTVGASADAAST